MVAEDFDELVTTLSQTRSRRGLLAGLAGAVGLSLGLPGAARASGCRAAGSKCRIHAQCCSHICDHSVGTCAGPGTVRCNNGSIMTCGQDQLLNVYTCTCVDRWSCGSCQSDEDCGTGHACVNGSCCASTGGSCSSDEDCCYSMYCVAGTCKFGV